MNSFYPEDTEKYHIKGWVIRYSPSLKTLWCSSPRGHLYIITETTYSINHIPKFLYARLNRLGLLDFWREAQKQKALERLEALRKANEKKDGKYVSPIWINAP